MDRGYEREGGSQNELGVAPLPNPTYTKRTKNTRKTEVNFSVSDNELSFIYFNFMPQTWDKQYHKLTCQIIVLYHKHGTNNIINCLVK